MSPADSKKPLVPYLRQSRAREKTISLDDQRRSIRAWAKNAGVKLAPEVVEQGVSGNKSWRERELGRAVEACQRGEAGGIVVAFQDRLSRENGLATAEVWEALEKAQARLVCSSEGLDTLNGNDDDELVFSMKAALARQQWKRHRRNWANAKHAAWERGVYVATPPPGYGRSAGLDGKATNEGGEPAGLVPNGHAQVVRRAFEIRAATPRASWSEVARLFEEAGIETRFGSERWSAATLHFLIANEVYTGLHRCTCGCGEEVVREDWEVVPGWLYRKAQVEPTGVSRVRGDGHPLGQGLVKCSTCGTSLIRSTSSRGAILRCPTRGAGHASITYEPAREWIFLEFARYIGPRVKKDGKDAEVSEAEARLADARAALAEVEEMLGTTAPAGSKQRLAVQEAEDALAGIDRTDEISLGSILTPVGVKQHIESLPVAEQRRALRSVIERVVLRPGRLNKRDLAGSLTERITLHFKDGSVSPGFPVPVDVAGTMNSGEGVEAA
jgi:DNA invertase Pin-like site-specific DNA recombinase